MMKKFFLLLSLCSFLFSEETEKESEKEVALLSVTPPNALQQAPLEMKEVNSSFIKNKIYFLMPPNLAGSFSLPGAAFRHYGEKSFWELSFFSRKSSDIVIARYKEEAFFSEKGKVRLGAVYENLLSGYYAFKGNAKYADPYFSLGVSSFIPYRVVCGKSSLSVLPAVSTSLGLDFRYGFLDLGIHYLPIQWKYTVKYEEPGYSSSLSESSRVLANLRLGWGFSF